MINSFCRLKAKIKGQGRRSRPALILMENQFYGFHRLICGFFLMSFISIGCSPVEFSKGNNGDNPCHGQSCIGPVNPDVTHYDYSTTLPISKVDILFVSDNSASMSTEQRAMAEQFGSFIAKLSNGGADFRVAITTTDISSAENGPRGINKEGALQDGKLVSFGNGSKFLTPNSGEPSKIVSLFNSAIVRPETQQCENYITGFVNANGKDAMKTKSYRDGYLANCPADDERGIYAANMVLKNNPDSFLRKDASLAVILLADEDERSQYYDPYFSIDGYKLEEMDQPSKFVQLVLSLGTSKSFNFHSIIVKDPTCKTRQEGQLNGLVGATYGNLYAKLTNLTGGILGDICASSENYANQMSAITGKILNSLSALPLKCATPLNLQVTVNGTTPGYLVSPYLLKFTSPIRSGQNVKLSYDCENKK